MSKLLIDDFPLMVLPKLALQIGLNEAIFLQQLHWLCGRSNHDRDGYAWIYNTAEGWQENAFPFWSVDTIRRTIKSLTAKNVIVTTSKYNKMKFDRTTWFRVDYSSSVFATPSMQNAHTVYAECPEGSMQNAKKDVGILPITIPETTQETIQETIYTDRDGYVLTEILPANSEDKGETDQVVNAWNEYMGQRKKQKWPTSDYAKKLLTNKLSSLAKKGYSPVDLLNEAIVNNWKSVWEPKSFLSGAPAAKPNVKNVPQHTQGGVIQL